MRKIGFVLFASSFFLCESCQFNRLAADEKYSSDYLEGEIRIIRTDADTTYAELRVKNKAKKTSYRDMSVALQCYGAKKDSICYTMIDIRSAPLKPRKKMKHILKLSCEKQRIEAITVHYVNGRSEKPK